MKKINIIAPILGTTAALAPAIALTSCNNARTIVVPSIGTNTWGLNSQTFKDGETIIFELDNSTGYEGWIITMTTGGWTVELDCKINNYPMYLSDFGSNQYKVQVPRPEYQKLTVEIKVIKGTVNGPITFSINAEQ